MLRTKAGPPNGKTYNEESWNNESSVDSDPYRSAPWSHVVTTLI